MESGEGDRPADFHERMRWERRQAADLRQLAAMQRRDAANQRAYAADVRKSNRSRNRPYGRPGTLKSRTATKGAANPPESSAFAPADERAVPNGVSPAGDAGAQPETSVHQEGAHSEPADHDATHPAQLEATHPERAAVARDAAQREAAAQSGFADQLRKHATEWRRFAAAMPPGHYSKRAREAHQRANEADARARVADAIARHAHERALAVEELGFRITGPTNGSRPSDDESTQPEAEAS